MNDAEIWTIIGVLTAALFGVIGIVTQSFTRVLHAEVGRLDARFDKLEGVMNVRFTAVEQRLDRVETRLDRVETRLDNLDTEVAGLAKRLFDRGD